MRSELIPGLAAVVLTTAACAGPHAPFEVGTQNAPVNLVLGARQAVVSVPVGPIAGPLPPSAAPFVPSGPAAPSAVPTVPPVVLPPVPCPTFDPLAPVSGGGITIPGPPQDGTYAYRAKVLDTMGTSKATYDGNSSWKVSVGSKDSHGAYHVTIDVTLGKTTSRRVLLIAPEPLMADTPTTSVPGVNTDPNSPGFSDPNQIVASQVNGTLAALGLPPISLPQVPNPGRYGPPGIYLVSQSSGASTFTPSVPIPLVQTPIGNNSFTGMGTDGSSVMTFTSTVKKRTNVNACGAKVEGIDVSLTNGLVSGRASDGTTQQVSFGEDLVFGLQFGGLPVADSGTITTGVGAGGASRTFSFTVNSVPKLAKS